MPIYEYRCDDGHVFDVMLSMTDDPISRCQVCDSPVQRVFTPVAVHFKGSGFYSTDYGKRRRGGDGDGDGVGGDSKDGGEKKDGAGKDGASKDGASKDGGSAKKEKATASKASSSGDG